MRKLIGKIGEGGRYTEYIFGYHKTPKECSEDYNHTGHYFIFAPFKKMWFTLTVQKIIDKELNKEV